jgi:orotidine-5'-phosphate decarboxylase
VPTLQAQLAKFDKAVTPAEAARIGAEAVMIARAVEAAEKLAGPERKAALEAAQAAAIPTFTLR